MVKHGKSVNERENKELRQEGGTTSSLRRIPNPHRNFNPNH